jgi:hypothetical protein
MISFSECSAMNRIFAPHSYFLEKVGMYMLNKNAAKKEKRRMRG